MEIIQESVGIDPRFRPMDWFAWGNHRYEEFWLFDGLCYDSFGQQEYAG
jgi:hypothetical protein